MDKKQISILVPERLVTLADETGKNWGQSRAFAMTRWMLEAVGMETEEALEYFPRGLGQAADSEKKSDVSATYGEGAELGRGKNPKRVGRLPEETWDSPVVPFEGVVGVEDMYGRVLTKEEVEAAGFGLPGPVFRTDAYLTKPENDFSVVGFTEEMLEKTDAQKKQELSYPESPDPVYPLMPLPPAIAKEAGQIMKAAETIEVPEAAVAFAKHLREKVEAFTGADPQTLNATENPHARTLQGVEAADAHRKAKSKKIAKVPPSTDPGKAILDEMDYASVKPIFDRLDKEAGRPVPPRDSGHDPKTCRMYGCLMCKLAKEEK